MEKLKIDLPIIVEGKYDKNKLSSILDAKIICTDGFGIFKQEEKLSMLRAAAQKTKLIVLTDSDGAGLQIRSHISSALPKDRLIHLYIPEIQGKERRKTLPSKSGLIGVEGVSAEKLRALFLPFESGKETTETRAEISRYDFYRDGFSGTDNSSLRRAALCRRLSLPENISSGALLTAANLLLTYDEYRRYADEIKKQIF